MSSIRMQALTSDSAWNGREMAQRRDWIHELSAAEIEDLDRAVAHARATGKPIGELSRADFPLGLLARSAEAWLDALDTGRGFVLVRGVPVERYGEEDASLAYWGLGLHLGRAVSQNAAGDLLCHVMVETPVKLTARQRELLQELEESMNQEDSRHSPRAKSWMDKVREFFAE